MKIAIATNDGIHITEPGPNAQGFHVFTIHGAEISCEELRQTTPSSNLSGKESPWKLVSDCSVVLVPTGASAVTQFGGLKTVPVNENLITSIIWNYISEMARQEANTCCCP
jgi:hypothetical protein